VKETWFSFNLVEDSSEEGGFQQCIFNSRSCYDAVHLWLPCQAVGEAGVGTVWTGVQRAVEILWPHDGDCSEDPKTRFPRGRKSEVPAGSGHHGTVQPSKCGEVVWGGHYGRACELPF